MLDVGIGEMGKTISIACIYIYIYLKGLEQKKGIRNKQIIKKKFLGMIEEPAG